MREIKFRGKRVDNGEWVIGDGIHKPKSWNYEGRVFIDGMEPRANDWLEVIPKTVGQYIGMKEIKERSIWDKQDPVCKEIYVGDKVRCLCNGVDNEYVVIFDSHELDFKGTKDGRLDYGHDFVYLQCCDEVEVIGNIHDEEREDE